MRARGDVTEGAVLGALLRHGHAVLIPFGSEEPYDLVVHLRDGRFVRVQCKTGREHDGCVIFNSCSTDHGRGRLDYRGRADVFGVFCPSNGRVFIVPVDEAATRATRLRLRPPRNGQARGIRSAGDYDVQSWEQAEARRAA